MRKKEYLALVPARGGSKRLPRKNILNLAEKPLIEWTIKAALEANDISTVCVSTDDSEIAEVSKKAGAEVPFIRSEQLATDTATSASVVKHALSWYKEKMKSQYEYFVLLQPTSPLRNSDDISSAISLLKEKNADAVISVCEMEHPPLWSNTLPESLSLENFISESVKNKRSQDIDPYYRLNGAIYICRVDRFLREQKFLFNDNIFAYIMPNERSVDIDTAFDFKIAELFINEGTR